MIDSHTTTSLADLPAEIIDDIFAYLEPKEFLNLCSTSKAFATLNLDPSYWRHVTRSTYRIPNQPLLQTDGARWKTLYQRLQTESRVYTWGSASHDGRDGLGHAPRPSNHTHSDSLPRYASRYGVGWPTEMAGVETLDPIVDLQCGGWSTTVLTSKGDLYSTGIIDGQQLHQLSAPSRLSVYPTLERLPFPPHLPQGERRLPITTIAQFSSGRSHVLGLSDSGTIWFWRSISSPALEVRFTHTDVPQGEDAGDQAEDARVTRVFAGWASSSAYVTRKGIVVWSERAQIGSPEYPDVWNFDDAIVPDTYYQRPRRKARETSAEEEALGKRVGEVVNHIVLEGYVVFLTDLGKVFAVRHGSADTLRQGIVELAGFGPSEGKPKMTELQGSFRSFAVFNTEGDVVIGDRDLLDRAWERAFVPNSKSQEVLPARPLALQNKGVISLAFGDWHKLALTREGRLMTFGKEPSACGCLGLGTSTEGGLLRGIWYAQVGWRPDGDSQQQWRQVWFSPEHREWLRYMAAGGIDLASGLARIREMTQDLSKHAQVADSIEKNGAGWDLHPELDDETQAWGRSEPAYLVLSIAAAGWHSGALVLANQKKIRKMYQAHAGFLPPFNSFETSTMSTDTNNAGLLSTVWDWTSSWRNWLSSWWTTGAGQTEQTSQTSSSAVEDQQEGHEHSYYHSDKPWTVLRRDLPDAARHEVFFPALSSDDDVERA